MTKTLPNDEEKALQLDSADPLKGLRKKFSLPKDSIYLCSNSLGLPCVSASTKMQNQMQKWAEQGVEGWFKGEENWYTSLDFPLRTPLSQLLGAHYVEVIVMNSLTVNLHLLLTSFYQPTEKRFKILMESPTFPSDLYAIKSHLLSHGLDPDQALLVVEPPSGEHLIRQEDIERVIRQEGHSIALVFLSSVNFLTGQVLNLHSLSKLAKEQGCLVGCDIAHAAGNIPLQLHAWEIDFAVGCSYKYLSSGPGGPGIAFVHSMHHQRDLPRLSGWWGNDPKKRFQMQLQPDFIPHEGAYSWQVSTPSILAMTPLLASMEIYAEAGIQNLRKKSEQQTEFLLELLERIPSAIYQVITPKIVQERGSQISLLFHQKGEQFLKHLESKGIICDFRAPNIIRVSPSPLYNTFQEIYEFTRRLNEVDLKFRSN